MAKAPRGIGSICLTTSPVEGLGPACQLSGGLWGVKTRQGRTVTTHGADGSATLNAASPHSNSLSVGQQFDVQAAGDLIANPNDADYVQCITDPTQPHSVAVYARALGTTDRTTLQSPRMRSELRRASRFIDLQALDDLEPGAPRVSRRLRVLCTTEGEIDVKSYELPTAASTGNFSSILSDITPLVFPALDSKARAVVFYDRSVQAEIAGQATLSWDTAPVLQNANNNGRTIAVQYNVGASDGPSWAVLLHEIMHNMGAVQRGVDGNRPPGSNTYGHCNDDADIMCYDEAGTTTYVVCHHTQLDCGNDTYFNAGQPAPGSWLADHWNVASAYNRYLEAANFTAPVSPDPMIPRAGAMPQVTGTGYVDERLTCEAGSWMSAASVTTRWMRGTVEVGTGPTWTPSTGDEAFDVACIESATSSTGHTTDSASSPVTVTRRPLIPALVSVPQIFGPGYVGAPLMCMPGTWTNARALSYRWIRAGTQIASGLVWIPSAADVGSVVSCEERATSETGHEVAAASTPAGAIMALTTGGGETATEGTDGETVTPGTTTPPAAVAVKLTTRLFAGSNALRCTSATRPCAVARRAKLSVRGSLSVNSPMTINLTAQRRVYSGGHYTWKRVTFSSFAAQSRYSRTLPPRSAGLYRLRVETVASTTVDHSTGSWLYYRAL